MKRIIAIILTASLIFASLGICVSAESVQPPYDNSQFFTMGDYTLHYRVIAHSGEFKGRILMLHGFLCSTFAWRNLASQMSAAGYECVLADLPNFGYSTRESADMTHIDREDLVTALMESIAPCEEWIIAGHSMGGGVAINIAEEESLRALLLYCPAPQNEFPENMKGLMTSSPMCSMMDFFFKYGTKITPLVRLIIYAATLDIPFSLAYDTKGVTAPMQLDKTGSGMCHMMFSVRATDLESTDKITCPVLICQAEKDLILVGDMKAQIASAFPNAQYYEVAGGGHQCIENRAGELSEVTLDFLAA